jgi:acyl dehydratase
MVDWSRQRRWSEIAVGCEIPPVRFPLSLYRLVMAAAATGDFNSIHHNSAFARAAGAPEAYANTMFLQGMWERTVREFVGLDTEILSISDFRMRAFCPAGSTVVVDGKVSRKWADHSVGFLEISVRSSIDRNTVVGPGSMRVAMPHA